MNVLSRGIRNTLRSPLRSGAIVLMLAISIGLVLAMLVARSSVDTKITELKATTATNVTINPAGVQGGMGSGDALTSAELASVKSTAHITSTSANLSDQLGSTDTSLTPSLVLGGFGGRQQRFEQSGTSESSADNPAFERANRPTPTPRTSVTGTNSPESIIPSDKLTSGSVIDGTSSDTVALVGKTLAEKNNLSVGSTFTAYGKTITVKGIYDSGNLFQNSSVIMPLATVQALTNQAGAVSNITAKVDNSDNVSSTVAALKSSLGDKADVTSQEEQIANSLQPLQSIASLAVGGVIAAAIAGAIIILLAMVMIVRERRREIGVIKAIGGNTKKVVGQFMSEALALTVISAAIGLVLGVLVSGPMTQSLVQNQSSANAQTARQTGGTSRSGRMLGAEFAGQLTTNIRQVSATLSPQTFAMSVGVVLLIAIVGSAIPAWFISRIRPAEVLRTE